MGNPAQPTPNLPKKPYPQPWVQFFGGLGTGLRWVVQVARVATGGLWFGTPKKWPVTVNVVTCPPAGPELVDFLK